MARLRSLFDTDEIGLGLKHRHDVEGENGKANRGWKGLALVGRIDLAEP